MRRIAFLFLLASLVTPLFFASAGPATDDLKITGGPTGAKFDLTNSTTDTTVSKIVGTIIRAALGLLGTIFLVMLVYAGYTWMTAGGNEEDVGKAKKLIAQAVIGLAIVMAAYAITAFVFEGLKSSLTGKTE